MAARSDQAQLAAVALFVARSPERFLPTVRSLLRHVPLPVVVGAPLPAMLDTFAVLPVERVNVISMAALINRLWAQGHRDLLAVSDAVLVPPDFVGPGLGILAGDLRVGTVSFFSNAAGYLSFPFRMNPRDRPPDGFDEVSVTRHLRSLDPPPDPAPIPVPVGAVTLLAGSALSAVGPLPEDPPLRAVDSVADFALAGRRRGFVDVLDPGTYYTRPSDLATEPITAWLDAAADLPSTLARNPFAGTLLAQEQHADASPFALAFAAARAKVLGLRLLIDGSCLGPQEMGTQVTVLALVRALAARADVADVAVLVPRAIPPYAREALTLAKVRAVTREGGAIAGFDRADVGHRPMQPDGSFDVAAWRRVTDRVVVSVLDLIAYQIGTYHPTAADWLAYRAVMQQVTALVDGVAVISEDVGVQVGTERLLVEPTRLIVAPYGSDHLTGGEEAEIPTELLARGYLAGEFLLTLGANYTHKNRDLAVRTLGVLRERGHKLSLVLVGASVPHGSSRALEERARGWDDDQVVFVLPDVTSAERNWLLRHAGVVLYPTAAEGFGLVPFEAARFGTPTVYVPFGPLAEAAGGPSGLPGDWDPEHLADAVERLLADPSEAERHISATLGAGESFTWARTADLLVSAYRRLLSYPPRSRA